MEKTHGFRLIFQGNPPMVLRLPDVPNLHSNHRLCDGSRDRPKESHRPIATRYLIGIWWKQYMEKYGKYLKKWLSHTAFELMFFLSPILGHNWDFNVSLRNRHSTGSKEVMLSLIHHFCHRPFWIWGHFSCSFNWDTIGPNCVSANRWWSYNDCTWSRMLLWTNCNRWWFTRKYSSGNMLPSKCLTTSTQRANATSLSFKKAMVLDPPEIQSPGSNLLQGYNLVVQSKKKSNHDQVHVLSSYCWMQETCYFLLLWIFGRQFQPAQPVPAHFL